MKWLMLAMLLVCSGCMVTFTATSKWSESTAPVDEELQAKYSQIIQGMERFHADILAAPNEIGAVNEVLQKHGIRRPQITK